VAMMTMASATIMAMARLGSFGLGSNGHQPHDEKRPLMLLSAPTP